MGRMAQSEGADGMIEPKKPKPDDKPIGLDESVEEALEEIRKR